MGGVLEGLAEKWSYWGLYWGCSVGGAGPKNLKHNYQKERYKSWWVKQCKYQLNKLSYKREIDNLQILMREQATYQQLIKTFYRSI